MPLAFLAPALSTVAHALITLKEAPPQHTVYHLAVLLVPIMDITCLPELVYLVPTLCAH